MKGAFFSCGTLTSQNHHVMPSTGLSPVGDAPVLGRLCPATRSNINYHREVLVLPGQSSKCAEAVMSTPRGNTHLPTGAIAP